MYHVLFILLIRENGNDEKYSEKGIIYKKKQNKKETNKNKKDADSCYVTACGCRGACISKNEERLNEGPRL